MGRALANPSISFSLNSIVAEVLWSMQVQSNYTDHNTSATIEFRENEIEGLAKALHSSIDENKGYISAALLARFDANATFPRLPFEPIDEECYTKLQSEVIRRRDDCDFFERLVDMIKENSLKQ